MVDIKTWGNNIWFLFHTLAHKIKEDKFLENKDDLIFVLKNICNNLPCPECSKDANEKLSKVNFNDIKTKEEYKILIFNFHNYVNKKLNKPLFDIKDLDSKYEGANLVILYNNFNIIFSSNSNVPQLMSASFHRRHILPEIQKKLNNLLNYMD
tara:strand:+ start:4674 stop:5132 length:459 start_codon:yes stop_codon:yes gene_type:complete